MNMIRTTLSAFIILTAPLGAFAAQSLDTAQTQHHEKIGVISASGATNLSDLEHQLSTKADAAGASAYEITEASGNNLLHGSAIIYK